MDRPRLVPATCTSLADCTSKIVWMTDNGATGRRTSNPQWSPDGSSLVFADRSSIDNPDAEVWTMRFGGTEADRRNISNSTNFDFRPAWGIPCPLKRAIAPCCGSSDECVDLRP